MLASGEKWDGVLLTSPEEVQDGEIPATEETLEISVERAIQASRGLDSAVQLVFGVDPGPRPGIAWLADGIVVGSAQLEQIDSVADHIVGLSMAVEHKRMCVKVGDGAPLIRDRIINQLILKMPFFPFIKDSISLYYIYGFVLISGAFIGMLGAYISVSKTLKGRI